MLKSYYKPETLYTREDSLLEKQLPCKGDTHQTRPEETRALDSE